MRCPHCRGSGHTDPEPRATVTVLKPRNSPEKHDQDATGPLAPVISLSAHRARCRPVRSRPGAGS